MDTISAETERASAGRRGFWAVLVLGFAVHLVATFFWMRHGGFFDRPPAEDASLYRLEAELFLERGGGHGPLGIIREGIRYPHFHPPVFPIVIALTSWVCGAAPEGVVLWIPTALFGALFLAGAAMIFRRVVRPSHQWLAAVVLLGAPGFIVYLRPAMSQMPMIALVLLSVAHLLASRWCERWWHVLAAGVWAGLAMLTKSLALIELGAFGGVFLIASLIRRPARRKGTLAAVALFAVPAAAIALPWYVANWESVSWYARSVTDAKGQDVFSRGAPPWSLERWLTYAWSFAQYGVGIPAAVTGGLAGLLLLGARIARRAASPPWSDGLALVCLLVTVAASYVVLTVGQLYANAYFIVQWIPVWAVLVAGCAGGLPRGLARAAGALVVVAALTMGALAYWSFEDPGPILAVGRSRIVDRFDVRCFTDIARDSKCRSRPNVEQWPVASMIQAAVGWTGRPEAVIGLICVENEYPRYLELGNVAYESSRRGLRASLKYVELNTSRREVDWVKSVLPSDGARVGIDIARWKVGAGKTLAEDLKPLLESVDALCIDARMAPAADIAGLALQAGFRAEPLMDASVTDKWRFRLFGIRRAP